MTGALDLSKYDLPPVIEALNYEALFGGFQTRFLTAWNAARAKDATLPAYDVGALETDPVVIVGQAYSYLRLLDRARANEAVKAVLPAYAKLGDLDHVVARANVRRLIIVPSTDKTPAVYEDDVALLRRYLLSFERSSAGSEGAYLYHSLTTLPGIRDAACLGPETHGRDGEVSVVILGADGRIGEDSLETLARKFRDGRSAPTTDIVHVLRSVVTPYDVSIRLTIPRGPDPAIVRDAAVAAVTATADQRFYVGKQVPVTSLSGAAYVPSVIRADITSPVVDIPTDPYSAPRMASLTVTVDTI